MENSGIAIVNLFRLADMGGTPGDANAAPHAPETPMLGVEGVLVQIFVGGATPSTSGRLPLRAGPH